MSDEISYIREQIKLGNYELVNDKIAIGPVYRISKYGNLDKDGFEVGYLYIPVGSGIKTHEHTKDIERYRKILGDMVINGKPCEIDICLLNKGHNVEPVSTDTFISTCKISKKYLETLSPVIINEDFFNKVSKRI